MDRKQTHSSLPHAIVAVIERDDGRILFIQRPPNDRYAGYWNPVTGRAETIDGGDLVKTCIREAREEVGLDVEVVGKIHESLTQTRHFVLHWLYTRPIGSDKVTSDPEEVSDYRWVTVEEIQALAPSFADTLTFFRERWQAIRVEALARHKGTAATPPITPVYQRLHAFFSGRVQGVYFRGTTERIAFALDVSGWVRNLPDGRVELMAEGCPAVIECLLAGLRKEKGPNISGIEKTFFPATGEFQGFTILR